MGERLRWALRGLRRKIRLVEEYDEVDFEEYEERTYFIGCTCEHESDEHGWGRCEVEGCPCEGGWEE